MGDVSKHWLDILNSSKTVFAAGPMLLLAFSTVFVVGGFEGSQSGVAAYGIAMFVFVGVAAPLRMEVVEGSVKVQFLLYRRMVRIADVRGLYIERITRQRARLSVRVGRPRNLFLALPVGLDGFAEALQQCGVFVR